MSTLILDLPDEQMRTLESFAQQRGTDVSVLVAELINSLTSLPMPTEKDGFDARQDPIYNIKSHRTAAAPDLSQHADRYLYETGES